MTTMMINMIISVVVEMCSRGNSFKSLAYKLLQYAATKIGQRQKTRARDVKPQRPDDRASLHGNAPQQNNIDKPCHDREHGFIDISILNKLCM
ncbi:Uncharacterised protein [Salmonella enterica subsp. arizonae]|uniref:Uncharacterized protein n=1 Tax=Salmonella enterica subsp. arizonae TaxID=59203 RepID=A0A379RYI7_SALER|nr:Uncharacterised protein [Salmonella enterica subsp. arizonae]